MPPRYIDIDEPQPGSSIIVTILFGKLTAQRVLLDNVLDLALVGHRHLLLLNRAAAVVETLRLVHRPLQRVALPPKHVVGVRAVAVALEAPHKRVGRAALPLAVELARVPDRLERHLRHAHRVRRRAGPRVRKTVRVDRVVHVRLVVGAVQVLAVPAGREVVRREDAARARLGRHVGRDGAAAAARHALVAKADVVARLAGGAADRHAEPGRERRHRLLLKVVARQVVLCVVHRQAALGAVGAAQQGLHGDVGHAVVAAVVWALEVQHRRPVVGKVLRHLARCARRPRGHITCHRHVEGVAADNVVHMRRGERARLARRIEPLVDERRAWEPQSGVRRNGERQKRGRERLHCDQSLLERCKYKMSVRRERSNADPPLEATRRTTALP
ncbi:uncharacterized protein SPSK_04359 [Sporothrix schenckii 1099-18]|uniref:Uncharacterized protein n=1 Tax=Sporothrix schenckii 1099-18 TaxID=1397361 RepID=A0A0F2M1N2_SPOSC|nr:uncharacterized protein SPSK_04359 [Sporothrix schenckii 1099-18]KJR83613.1 hypothetical protein SPSK_04359 [Sporothrix schenckii 1099-18]